MKKLLISAIVALIPLLIVNAQTETQPPPRQALRVGVGINVSSFYTLEPLISVDYQYVISDYFDINVNFHHGNFSYYDEYESPVDGQHYDPSIRLMVTPFPKWFRYVQIGVGIKYLYGKYTYGREIYLNPESYYTGRVYDYMRLKYSRVGFTFPIRLYLINNNKYQLFADYYFDFLHEKKYTPYFIFNRGGVGINFGVKF